jgi:uncharacterized protein (TIGR03086 family)
MPADLRPGPDSPPTDELDSAEATLKVLQQVLHTIAADDMSRQTPCTEFDVRQLTGHLLNSITVIGGAVDAQLPPHDETESAERQIIAAARPALDAWHRHGLNGMVMVGPNEAPAAVMAGVLSIEFLVHAWDYAMATGRDVTATDSLADYVLDRAREIITPEGRSNVGFDQPVEVPADAGAMDQLIAFTGRNPAR